MSIARSFFSSLLPVNIMSSCAANCWTYFLAASSPWITLKKRLSLLSIISFSTSSSSLSASWQVSWSCITKQLSIDHPYSLPYELLSVLAFENLNEYHIHWLQMACAIWGEKHNFSVFQSSVISWGVQYIGQWTARFFFGLSLSGELFAQETPQKWLKSSMNWNLLCIWWGVFFLSSGVCCTCQSPVEVISFCYQCCNLTNRCSSLARITFLCQSLTGLEIIKESGFMNIKHWSFVYCVIILCVFLLSYVYCFTVCVYCRLTYFRCRIAG